MVGQAFSLPTGFHPVPRLSPKTRAAGKRHRVNSPLESVEWLSQNMSAWREGLGALRFLWLREWSAAGPIRMGA